MTAKLEPFAAAPAMMKAWMAISNVANNALEPSLAELVKIRASQIKPVRQLHQHAHDRRARPWRDRAASPLTAAWREAPCFTDRERAALAWTEALTKQSEGQPARENLYVTSPRTSPGGAGEADHASSTSSTAGTASQSASACGWTIRPRQRRPRDRGRQIPHGDGRDAAERAAAAAVPRGDPHGERSRRVR